MAKVFGYSPKSGDKALLLKTLITYVIKHGKNHIGAQLEVSPLAFMILESTLCTTVGEHPATFQQRSDYKIHWSNSAENVVEVTNHFYNWI